jgi:DNA-binding NarL/FixJ family response regulator
VQAIRVVASGGVWLDQTIIRILADQSADRAPQLDKAKFPNVLTDREQRVLLGIFGGLTNRKIGQDLGLSESSVKTTVQQLFYRTGVRTRSQLVRAVLEGSLEAAKELTGQARNATANPDSDKACPAIPDNL